MSPQTEQQIETEARQFLSEISRELEDAAAGAKHAAAAPRDVAWKYMQQLYSRLQQANHLVAKFQARIDTAR